MKSQKLIVIAAIVCILVDVSGRAAMATGCGDGLRQAAETAVLAANYLAARLKGRYRLPFPPPYAHEFIAVPDFPASQVTEQDIAKRLIDHGIHPPTMS